MTTLLVACGDGDPAREWTGTVRDSAGIAIVDNPAEADWSLATRPELIEELRIGVVEGDAVFQFGSVTAIDVDEAGRIYVLDQQAAQVRVFDADGRHLRTVGSPGQGPGELSAGVMAVLSGNGDTVYVADLVRQRIAAFGPSGEEIGSVSVPLQAGIPVRWQPTPEGRLAVQTRTLSLPGTEGAGPSQDLILIRDPNSEVIDTVFELRGSQSIDSSRGALRIRLLESEPVWTMLADGRIAHGRSDGFRIEIVDVDGTLDRVITKPTDARAVSEEDRTAMLDMLIGMVEQQLPAAATPGMADELRRSVDFAERFPVMGALMAGPRGTLWAQRLRTPSEARAANVTINLQTSDLGSPTWDVLDQEGRLLGPITLPDRFTPLRVRGDHVYGVIRDDLDVQRVVRLRMVGAESY